MSEKNKPFFLEWGWVYWDGFIYHSVLDLIFGKAHRDMYKRVAEMVGNSSVLDLCCGDGRLSQWIPPGRYTGIEQNPRFVRSMRRRGINAIDGDVRSVHFPAAECAVLLESLYHFLPDGLSLIDKILSYPFHKVIVVESLSHVSHHSNSVISKFALWSTRVRGQSFGLRLSPRDFQERLGKFGFVTAHANQTHIFAVWERGKGS